MKQETSDSILKAVYVVVVVVIVFIAWVAGLIGYQSGQIDALNGKQGFKMVTNTVSKVTWERIK